MPLTRSNRVPGCTAFLLVCIAGGLLLSGCTSLKERQARARAWWAHITGTASGALMQVEEQIEGTVDLGKTVVDTVQESAQSAKDRVENVREGIEKIQEGKKLIEEGLGE
ncbi:hypothetical protein COU80_00780 [Candidatus Peregrinibacteria bacterium CG10_big_fil_rev_8_21_14_0_10_55_24]|nr:MAG: hypothetical protein COU80_00780 [Candidatus Peregrinibacteria bacterium CG10_big_fil_rev_8_21_14_0_10_55_24]